MFFILFTSIFYRLLISVFTFERYMIYLFINCILLAHQYLLQFPEGQFIPFHIHLFCLCKRAPLSDHIQGISLGQHENIFLGTIVYILMCRFLFILFTNCQGSKINSQIFFILYFSFPSSSCSNCIFFLSTFLPIYQLQLLQRKF